MKNIKRLIICLLVIVLTTFDVQAKVKESTSEYTEDMYIIGSTRFESEYIITASRAANAGADEAFVQQNVYGNSDFRGKDIKTYYYCVLDKTWSEVLGDGQGLRSLSSDEVTAVENALNIFYVNNEEKTLEVPFNDTIDEDSIVGPFSGKATIGENKVIIPATWINGFSFTSEGANVEVEMGLGEEEGTLDEYETPVIRMDAKLSVTLPGEVQDSSEFEFTLNIKSNGNDGKTVTTLGVFSADDPQVGNIIEGLKYYDETTSSWKEINNMGEAFDNVIKDVTVKYKAKLVNYASGKVNFNLSLVTSDNKVYKTSASMHAYALNSIVLVNGEDYSDLAVAFATNKEGTFKLLSDAEVNETIILDNGKVTLDLNGKTLSFASKGVKLRIGNKTNMTVKNGTVKGLDYTLQAEDNAVLTVGKDVNIVLDDTSITKNKYGITYWDQATVNFEGNITVTGDSIGISGNGNLSNTGTLNILGGTITASEGFGLYLPNAGVTNISGGEISANTAIAIRSGELNITGGKVSSTGEKVVPNPRGGGINSTGDAIYIEENPSYQDNIRINITGGEISSKNGYIIQELNTTTDQVSVITGKYTTKHILVNDDLVTYYYDDEAANLTVTERGVENNYTSDDLVNLAANMTEGTIKLGEDLDVSKVLFTGKVTLDLNGKTLSVTEANKAIISDANANLTIKNGTIKGINYALQVEDDAVLTIEKDVNIIVNGNVDGSRYGVTMWENGTLNFEGNIKVTGGIGISGNGMDKKYNAKLNVTGGTVTVEDGTGIYLPHYGTTVISGGEITAPTGINIKAGSLDITGGTIKATGEKVSPKVTTGKTNETGDAIIIEENTNYADNIKLNITGGTLESANGYLVQEYNPTIGTSNELTSVITGKYIVKNVIDENTFYYTMEE